MARGMVAVSGQPPQVKHRKPSKTNPSPPPGMSLLGPIYGFSPVNYGITAR
jgi:hypothetical protein